MRCVVGARVKPPPMNAALCGRRPPKTAPISCALRRISSAVT